MNVLEQGEILELSNDKEYVVISSIIYQGANYVYIIDTETYKDYKVCKYQEEELEDVTDDELFKNLIFKFNKDLKANLAKVLSEI